MRITGALVLAMSLGAAVTGASATVMPRARRRQQRAKGAAPAANAAEVNKLKAVRFDDPKAGAFKWGMKPDEVWRWSGRDRGEVQAPDHQVARSDPQFQQRVRDQMVKEVAAVKKSYTKFEGQKSGWDVSIIGQEFSQNTGEAVLVSKEDTWTRYSSSSRTGSTRCSSRSTRTRSPARTFRTSARAWSPSRAARKRSIATTRCTAGSATRWTTSSGPRRAVSGSGWSIALSSTASTAWCCSRAAPRTVWPTAARS